MKKNTLVLFLLLNICNISFAQKNTPTLNHIAQYVVNLKISSDFYSNIVGLDTIPEPFHDGKHTWFQVGYKSHLHLIQGSKEATIKEKNSHLCFTVQSVASFIQVLNKNNIGYENWAGQKNAVTKRIDGVQQIYFTDPDGYWIEINDAKR
jgi:lactoylglutathione lyase